MTDTALNSQTPSDDSALRRAEERFRLVVESSPVAMVIVDAAARIVLVNQQTEACFGYQRIELIGEEIERLIPHRFHDQHQIDRDRFLAAPQARPMGVGHNLFGRRQDGSEFPVDVSLHPMQTSEGILVTAHIVDLTERQQAEREVQRNHSLERLALLGQLAGGVAHEIRNPLGVIRNAAYYLNVIRDALDWEGQDAISEILQEVARANHIVDDLLDYARSPRKLPITFDLVKRATNVVASQTQTLGATITTAAPPDPLTVVADPDHVDRILINLIRNGVQANHDGSGCVLVSMRADAETAIVDVRDNGKPVSDSDRQRLFEPLFTTKAKGIGLGLAVSKRYAEFNGGSLELLNSTEDGSTFRLILPRHDPNMTH